MKIHWQKLRGETEAPLLILDLVVLVLISIDLSWLLLDALLLRTGFGVLLQQWFGAFFTQYQQEWHARLLVYDSVFTVFLVSELLLRWSVAIVRGTYFRWFFYPFVNWYDVLGCIPLPLFRALRLLRLISILYRLQQLGVVDIAESQFFIFLRRYYRIVLEELSDRIVINILEGVQREIRSGGSLTHRVSDEILRPQRGIIVPWLSDLLADTSAHAHILHRERLAAYLGATLRETIATNPEMQDLKRRLLVAGPLVEAELQKVVPSLVNQAVDQALGDLGRRGNIAMQDIAAGLFDTLIAPNAERDEALRRILLDAIDLVKEQVSVQQWKQEEAAPKPAIP